MNIFTFFQDLLAGHYNRILRTNWFAEDMEGNFLYGFPDKPFKSVTVPLRRVWTCLNGKPYESVVGKGAIFKFGLRMGGDILTTGKVPEVADLEIIGYVIKSIMPDGQEAVLIAK